MNEPENSIIVLDIAGNTARLTVNKPHDEEKLVSIGFRRESNQLIRPITDEGDRKKLAADLIALNALFSSGRDWSPEELVRHYADQGVITQKFRTISWRSPTDFIISTITPKVD